jgi:protein-disulfide isomerase
MPIKKIQEVEVTAVAPSPGSEESEDSTSTSSDKADLQRVKRVLLWYALVLALLLGTVGAGLGVYNLVLTSKKVDERFSQLSTQISQLAASQTPQQPKLEATLHLGPDVPRLGDPNAPVTIVEYADFQCPFCEKVFQSVLPQIKTKYIASGKANFVFQDFAFLGPESTRAAEAAKCAGAQGKFWDYHDTLYQSQNGENQGAFADPKLKGFAKTLGLDITQFNTCLTTKKYDTGDKNKQ